MRPTREQLKMALDAADRMRRRDVDPHHVAAALRYLSERNSALEELLVRADRFIRFGMPEQELSEMRQLVNRLRESAVREGAANEEDKSLEIDSSMLL